MVVFDIREPSSRSKHVTHVFTLEVSFSVDTHFLSRRSIRGLRTDSASMAALLPLAEPFIWTSSWFICFTQSSITGLKLGDGKQRNLLLWNAIMHFRWGKTRRLEEALAHRCQSYWITIKVSRARWSFIQAEMFSTSISSLSAVLSEGSIVLWEPVWR